MWLWVWFIACTPSFSPTDSGCAQTTSSLFQCQPSSGGDGLVYTPNIPDFYFSHENAADFRTGDGANLTTAVNGFTYIFIIPPQSAERNCSGDVVAIQYCYQAKASEIDKNVTIYTFHYSNGSEFNFTGTPNFAVNTIPQENDCTRPPRGRERGIERVCCDMAILGPTNQFKLSSNNFTFGISLMNPMVLPLAFAGSVADPMRIFSIRDGEVEADRSLLILRLFIGMINVNFVQDFLISLRL